LAESVDKTTGEEEEEELSTWVRDQEDEKEMDEMPPDADDLVETPVLTRPAPQKQCNINPVEMQFVNGSATLPLALNACICFQ
jgi:hypothetical protein